MSTKPPRFEEWSKDFLDGIPNASTRDRYSYSIQELKAPFKNARLSEITPNAIEEFKRARRLYLSLPMPANSNAGRHGAVNMGSNVECLFRTDNLRGQWEEWYRKTLNQFKLPPYRLLCGFDDERSFWFYSQASDARALHVPTTAAPTPWPGFLERRRKNAKLSALDSLIYIPLVAPTNVPFAFVVTFAHELQHFVQCWTEPPVWEANDFRYKNLLLLDAAIPAYETWRVPTERDAMIKSKRVAVSLFGEEIVQEELRSLVSHDKTTKEWEFLLGVSPSAACNLCNETGLLVRTYEKEILGLRSKWPPGIDFTKPDWCK